MKKNQTTQKIDLGQNIVGFDHSETVFLVGRSKECHVVLDDKQISREHLKLVHLSGKWFAQKITPENACLCNGDDFDKIELDVGDTLTVGQFTLNVDSIGEDAPTPLEASPVFTSAPAKSSPAAAEPLDDLFSSPEVEPVITKAPAPAATVASKKESEPAIDQDATREIDADDLTSEVDLSPVEAQTASDATREFDISDGIDPMDEPKSSTPNDEGSDFSFSESNEENDDLGLGLNSEGGDGGSELNPENASADGDGNYSLENIDSGLSDESTQILQSFAKVQLELFGESAPYDKYLIEKELTYIGRDPAKCQIVLNDNDVSSVHAVLRKNNIMITLEDLNSSNGTLLNGDRINKAILNHNDEFIIGEVTFTVKFKSEFLVEEDDKLLPVDTNQTVEVEEVIEVSEDDPEASGPVYGEDGEVLEDQLGGFTSPASQEKSIIKRIWKDDEKRKKAIYALVGLALVWMMMPEEQPKPTQKANPNANKVKKENPAAKGSGVKLSEEERRSLSARYEIGKNHYYNGRYREALDEFQKIASRDPNFNPNLQSLIQLSKEGLSKLEEQEKKRIAEQQAAERKIKIKDLIEKAREYTKDRRVEMAQQVFTEVATLDPENIEISKLKLELEDWQKEKTRKELEEVTKKKAREDRLEKLKPGKTYYLQKEWFKAIGKLEDFMKIKDMDEDLTKEASDMLKTSKEEIGNAVAPLQGKAKSLMEGQDLKGAYEVYQQILKIEPSNTEALNQVGDIKEQLTNKARKIYREAIISESLSLFQDAKEKFQEVQQISPVDSDYYKKASEKLRDYLE